MPDPIKLIADLDERFDWAKQEREVYSLEWQEALAFLYGRQWVVWNPVTKRWEEPPAPEWKVRAVHNYLLPRHRQAVSKISRNRPTQTVTPNTKEEEDLQSARVGTKLMEYLYWELGMDAKTMDLVMWGTACGTAFLKAYWNAGAGEHRVVSVNGENRLIRIGEVGVDVVSPFEIFPEPTDVVHPPPWLFHARVHTTQWVKDHYEIEVEPEQGLTTAMVDTSLIANMGGDRGWAALAQTILKDHVMVKEYWEMPTREHSKGRLVVYANKVMLAQVEELPFRSDALPFCKFDYDRLPARYWARGVITPSIPMQVQYNQLVSKLLENANLTANPKWKVPRTANINANALTSRPNEKVYYDGPVGPEMIQPASPPPYVRELLEVMRRDLMEIPGLHEVSSGQVPGQVTAGVSIELLQESDDTQLSGPVRRLNDVIRAVGQWELLIAQQRYREPRVVRITGRGGGETEVHSFMASDLSGCADVIVQETSALGLSKAAREQRIIDYYDRGLLGPPGSPEARKIVFQQLELGDIYEVYKQVSAEIEDEERQKALLAAVAQMAQGGGGVPGGGEMPGMPGGV